MWKKTISLLMAVAMIGSIVAIQPSNAAVEYFQFQDYSTSDAAPTQVNSGTIEIIGTYNSVASDSINFKIETIRKLPSGDYETIAELNGTGVTPMLEGINGFRFSNVKLPSDGLNRITVFGKSSGNNVTGVAYVYYPNVPTIYNIKLPDDRVLEANKPTVVNMSPMSLMLTAPNATTVTVQGKSAFSGGADNYLASNIELKPGLNTIQITASNATMTYSVTRDVVFYDGKPTAYGVMMGTTNLDGNPTVGPNSGDDLAGKITGYLAVELDPAEPLPVINDVQVQRQNGVGVAGSPSTAVVTLDQKLTVTGATYSYGIYKFETNNDFTVNVSDDYRLYINGTYASKTVNFPMTFTFRSSTSPIIQEVRQLYNVTTTGTTATATSTSLFTDGLVFFNAPIWLSVKASNFDQTDGNKVATLSVTQGGVNVTSPEFTYENENKTYYQTPSGELVFKITNLPAGEQTLNIKLENTSTGEAVTKSIPLTFVPTPFIELTNMYNTKEYSQASEFTAIIGRLVNFNLGSSADLNSIQVTVNGTTLPMPAAVINAATGEFNYPIVAGQGQELVDGPNRIIISGRANGVPVSTSITVFLFSPYKPLVLDMRPVPEDAAEDTAKRFSLTDSEAYTTNEKTMDVLFNVFDATDISVSVDGKTYTGTQTGTLTPQDSAKMTNEGAVSRTVNGVTITGTRFRLNSIPLPATGTVSITVVAAQGTSTGSQTLQVTRVQVPYSILSPKFPEEQVINQNFVHVSIKAEGAEQVLIGKDEMEKGTNDIFRLMVNDLKSGKNTIKFTIVTGNTKQNGQFTITYAAQNEVGAQYRAPMPSSGKLSAFNSAVSITFPKGTMLKNPENKQLTNAPQIDLFNNQQLLLGIADKNDGRTVKEYNPVGQFSGATPLDGTLVPVAPHGFAINVLTGSHTQFNYASELFWIDAGYFAGGSNYETVDGMHPYADNDQFFIRGQQLSKWLEPTNRGEITLKYNPNIRNEAARNLSIWYFGNNRWINLGGTVKTSSKTITAPMSGFGYYAVMSVRYGFEDITGHRYARNQLDTMFAKGIMEPKGGNLFGVYDNITRGEFATMIVKMLDIPLNYDTDANKLTFTDVPPISLPGAMWDYRYVETAARSGIISGIGPRVFNPGGFLTREQAAAIIARAMNYKLGDPDKALAAMAKQFVDSGMIDYYALTSVQAVVKDKIMQGQPNPLQEGEKKPTFSFNPKANLNRADMAIIAYNIMTDLKRF